MATKTPYIVINTDQWTIDNTEQWIGIEIIEYFILQGVSNNFSSVWAEPKSGLSSGRMFVGGINTFCVVDLERSALIDYYSTTVSGRAKEALIASDLLDLNVV